MNVSTKNILIAAVIAAALALPGSAVVQANTATPPIPAAFPGATFGDLVIRFGTGTTVDANGIHVDCGYVGATVNVLVDGNWAQVPVTCS